MGWVQSRVMGLLDFLNNLFPAKPNLHEHNWIQFSKKYWVNQYPEFKERCDRCYRVRIVGNAYNPIERFTSYEAIMDDIQGFMRYAFKI